MHVSKGCEIVCDTLWLYLLLPLCSLVSVVSFAFNICIVLIENRPYLEILFFCLHRGSGVIRCRCLSLYCTLLKVIIYVAERVLKTSMYGDSLFREE